MRLYRSGVLYFLLASFFIVFSPAIFAHTDGGIAIKEAWVREAPPNAKVMAAYMKIENHTATEKVLTGVTSSAFGKIEIHKTMQKDGMASMQQQKQLTIPAQGEVTLQPGGMHMMLFDPAKALKAGDEVNFTLKFANGSTSMTTATVRKATGSHHEHHSHENHNKDEMPNGTTMEEHHHH